VVDRYALALPSHVPAATAKGFTLSTAKQAFSGRMDDVIETIEHNASSCDDKNVQGPDRYYPAIRNPA
jgi:hypothetical protein